MPEELNPQQQSGDKGAGQAGASGAAQTGGDGANRDDTQQKPYADPVAYAAALEKRLQERDKELNALQARLDEQDRNRQQQLQQSGQFEELYKSAQSKLAEYEPKAKAHDELIEEIRLDNKRRVDALPEDVRDIVPQLAPVDMRRWLDKAESRLLRPAAPSTDAGAGVGGSGGSSVKVTQADIDAAEVAKAQGYKVTPEEIAKRRQRK